MRDGCLTQYWRPAPSLRQFSRTGGWARSDAFIELRASVFGQPVIVVDEPELTAIGAALIAAQGATGVALPFGQGLALQKSSRSWPGPSLMPNFIKTTACGLMQLQHDSLQSTPPKLDTLQRGLNRERAKFGDAT
jgi:FGGY family of carbohydrate kinases, C-terminal domain